VHETRRASPGTTIELLVPDFKGSEAALRLVVDARPDILNHNLETVPRLYRIARPGGRYDRALELIGRIKQLSPDMLSKSGIMVGLGEQWDELLTAIRDLRGVERYIEGCWASGTVQTPLTGLAAQRMGC